MRYEGKRKACKVFKNSVRCYCNGKFISVVDWVEVETSQSIHNWIQAKSISIKFLLLNRIQIFFKNARKKFYNLFDLILKIISIDPSNWINSNNCYWLFWTYDFEWKKKFRGFSWAFGVPKNNPKNIEKIPFRRVAQKRHNFAPDSVN